MRRLAFALLCVLLPLAAAAQLDEQQVWKDFLEWFKTQPFGMGGLTSGYQEALAARGDSQTAIADKLAIVQKKAAGEPPELTGILFDKIYRSDKPLFSREPSAFLLDAVRGRKPGRALDVAMGQGRNAVFLAEEDWDVTGFDLSEEGLAIAGAAARKSGVQIKAVLASQEQFDFGKRQWDLVALIYSWMPLDKPEFVQRVKDSVKPGGIIVVEQFNAPPGTEDQGPPNALIKTFGGLRVLRYEETFAPSDWSAGKKAHVGRIVVQVP